MSRHITARTTVRKSVSRRRLGAEENDDRIRLPHHHQHQGGA